MCREIQGVFKVIIERKNSCAVMRGSFFIEAVTFNY